MTVLRPAEDASPADWIVASLTTFAESVTSLVPVGFEAYVRSSIRERSTDSVHARPVLARGLARLAFVDPSTGVAGDSDTVN